MQNVGGGHGCGYALLLVLRQTCGGAWQRLLWGGVLVRNRERGSRGCAAVEKEGSVWMWYFLGLSWSGAAGEASEADQGDKREDEKWIKRMDE